MDPVEILLNFQRLTIREDLGENVRGDCMTEYLKTHRLVFQKDFVLLIGKCDELLVLRIGVTITFAMRSKFQVIKFSEDKLKDSSVQNIQCEVARRNCQYGCIAEYNLATDNLLGSHSDCLLKHHNGILSNLPEISDHHLN